MDNNNNTRKRTGMDTWLQNAGKNLKTGDEIRLRLVKGPNIETTADPVDGSARPEAFPAILKFPVSVKPPDFNTKTWKESRLYQQDIPKPVDDSDEETTEQPTKKRWRYNKNVTKRQWILQEQVDFLETMLNRRKNQVTTNTVSSRYEGVPEHNPSSFVLMTLNTMGKDDDNNNSEPTVSIRAVPAPNGTIAFQQPASRRSLTLTEAEQAIQDQRTGIALPNLKNLNKPAHLRKPTNNTKNRLLQKLQKAQKADDVEEADDVMGDVTFRNRKGTSGGARRELLASMGDGLTVSDDGVLGGTNDQAFGGRQRFGKFQASEDSKPKAVEKTERGADGAAMQDDFYQRDVGKEYEEMDYDANEQFDDDDVDVGETEMHVVGGDRFDEDEEDDIEDVDDEEDAVEGVEGLATVAGFKAMLAKARGEAPVEKAEQPEQQKKISPKAHQKKEKEMDHIAKIMAAAEKSAQAQKEKAKPGPAAAAAATAASIKNPKLQVDENGLRIITLEAVQNEIWLNHGSIPINRLIKLFDAKKKHGVERQNKFRDVVKELCTMTNHPVNGRTLVLKQHYRHNLG